MGPAVVANTGTKTSHANDPLQRSADRIGSHRLLNRGGSGYVSIPTQKRTRTWGAPGSVPGSPGPVPGSPGPVPGSPERVPGVPGTGPGGPGPVPGTPGRVPGVPGTGPGGPRDPSRGPRGRRSNCVSCRRDRDRERPGELDLLCHA